MSSHLENSDSDLNNSWILLDDKGKANDDEEEKEEKVEEMTPRKTFQDMHEFEDSDGISIISDPEDSHTECKESFSGTIETIQNEPEFESAKGKELVSIEPKPVKTSGSITSALFIIAGLLIALYFQTGYEDEASSAPKSQFIAVKSNNLVYETSKLKHINSEDYTIGKSINNKKKIDNEFTFKNTHKDYAMKSHYEGNDKHEKGIKDKYFKKHKNGDSSDEKMYKKKYDSRENDYKYNKDHEEYLMKKQHYLRQKEDKLKQKELKIHSKNSREYKKEDKHQFVSNKYIKYDRSMSGEWYGKMYKGRDEIRSNERKSEWVFDRAQMRDKKRNKAHWYFNWMDEREDVRIRG